MSNKLSIIAAIRRMFSPLANDDNWITVKPNGPNAVGRPALLGEGGEIKAGMGGKFNGQKISSLKTKSSSKPGSKKTAKKQTNTQPKPSGPRSAMPTSAVKPDNLAGGMAHVTGSDYTVIGYLREKDPAQKAKFKDMFENDFMVKGTVNKEGKSIEDFIKDYDASFTPSTAPTEIYRGLQLEQKDLDDILKKGEIVDRAPISTTGTRSVAQSYLDGSRADAGNKKGVLLVIDAPTGTKSLDMVNAFEDKRTGNPLQTPYAQAQKQKTIDLDEVILARNQPLKIKRHEKNPDGTTTLYVTVESGTASDGAIISMHDLYILKKIITLLESANG